MINQQLMLSFSSELLKVKNVSCEIIKFLQDNLPNLSDSDKYELRLIFNELLINSVIHGNNEDKSKPISLSVEILPDNVVFGVISDEGIGFDYMKHINNMSSSINIYNESGRGIRLVCSLIDKIYFNAKGNQIKFYKRVSANG